MTLLFYYSSSSSFILFFFVFLRLLLDAYIDEDVTNEGTPDDTYSPTREHNTASDAISTNSVMESPAGDTSKVNVHPSGEVWEQDAQKADARDAKGSESLQSNTVENDLQAGQNSIVHANSETSTLKEHVEEANIKAVEGEGDIYTHAVEQATALEKDKANAIDEDGVLDSDTKEATTDKDHAIADLDIEGTASVDVCANESGKGEQEID